MVDPVKANYDKSYCHAAMSDIGELDSQQSRGNHCDLFAVGPPLFTITSGIPVSREKRTVLTFLFHQLQNNVSAQRTDFSFVKVAPFEDLTFSRFRLVATTLCRVITKIS